MALPYCLTNPTLRLVRTKRGLVTIERMPIHVHPGTTVECQPYTVFREGEPLGQVTRIGIAGRWAIDGRHGAWRTRLEAIEELQQRPQGRFDRARFLLACGVVG